MMTATVGSFDFSLTSSATVASGNTSTKMWTIGIVVGNCASRFITDPDSKAEVLAAEMTNTQLRLMEGEEQRAQAAELDDDALHEDEEEGYKEEEPPWNVPERFPLAQLFSGGNQGMQIRIEFQRKRYERPQGHS